MGKAEQQDEQKKWRRSIRIFIPWLIKVESGLRYVFKTRRASGGVRRMESKSPTDPFLYLGKPPGGK